MKRGISLIEILIVLAIIGLVSVLAYPAMVSTMAEQRLHRRANEIVQAMQFARFQAVFRGRPYIVRPAPVQNRPGGTLRIFEGMTPWACGNLGPEKTKPSDVAGIEGDGPYVALDTEEIGGDVGLIRVAAPGDVCFKPDGRAYDANGMPLTMPAADQVTFGVARSGYVGFLLQRYEGAEGGGLVARGRARRVLLTHLGMAFINTDMTEPEG